jgi:alpha,alpha-trehalose phosphorylase
MRRSHGGTRLRPCSSPTTRRRRASPGRGVHRARGLGLRAHGSRLVPADAALSLLRPLPQAGRQAGRPGASAIPEGDAFSPEVKTRDFEYYEALTVRDSSLSAFVQAVVGAEVGHLELAYDYFGEAALLDLGDLHHNTRDGVHLASLAGVWIAAVAGFGGMRDHGGSLSCAPRLPRRLSRLAFRLCFRGRRILVEVDHRQARYTLLQGAPLDVAHHGATMTLAPDEPVTRPIPKPPTRGPSAQPPGRAPRRRQPT